MKNNYLIKCSVCGGDVAKTAKVCPHCGAKIKKQSSPGMTIFSIVLIVFVLLYVAVQIEGPAVTSPGDDEVATYVQASVDDIYNDFNNNAANAKDKYVGSYVELTGRLGEVQVDGDYITFYPDNWSLVGGVKCSTTHEDIKDIIKTMTTNNYYTVKIKINSIGGVLGNTLEARLIEIE